MYGKGLKLTVGKRQVIDGCPVERYDIPLSETKKDVLLVVRVGKSASEDVQDGASKWIEHAVEKFSSEFAQYHGVVIRDESDIIIDVVTLEQKPE